MKPSILAALALASVAASASAQVNLANYARVGRYQLPEPTRSAAPAGNLLCQEASAVTWNRDTNTLFVAGDGGTSITQVSLSGQFINTMTLGPGSSPQGTSFYDPEGLTYIGGGQFVMVEERNRIANRFTYTPNTTLLTSSPGVQRVTLGTTIGNIGLEGVAFDPSTNGFIFVKEESPEGIFQTTINWAAGTASNGSASTVNSINLFAPNLAGLSDFADVYAVSASNFFGGPTSNNLLILSQADGRVVEVDRAGNVISQLLITGDPSDTISISAMQHEGMTMDDRGYLYIVSENGGGSQAFPELWVYAPIPTPGAAGLFAIAGLAAARRRR
ncbi:hypothetical protein BH11PLA1_BH11PLA1_20750 [soil metagenome]